MNKLILVTFAGCLLAGTAAFGQAAASVSGSASISAQAQPPVFENHPLRAIQKPLGREEDLLETSSLTYAHGERPVTDFPAAGYEEPLGDVARRFRDQHAGVKKASFIKENR